VLGKTIVPIAVSVANKLESPFLEGLTSSNRATIFAAASQRRARANSVAVHQGDPADYLFLIARGCARHFYLTPEGKKIALFWLRQGQIFGGSALLSTSSKYLVGTEMLKDSWLLLWHRSRIRALASQFPRLMDNALSVATDYLTWYLAAHASLVSDSAEQRLAQVMVTLAQGFGHKMPSGTCLELTNEQLASAANVTRFTASRILNRWQRNGAVEKTRGHVLLRSPEKLVVTRG